MKAQVVNPSAWTSAKQAFADGFTTALKGKPMNFTKYPDVFLASMYKSGYEKGKKK